MKYNIIKFLLSATLLIINGSNNAYSTVEYEELSLNDFTYEYLSLTKNYQVDENGDLYRTNIETGDPIYPIYDGYKCYDLQYAVSAVPASTKYILNNNAGNYNLVALPNKTNNVLELSNDNNTDNTKLFKVRIPSNTNLIIPKDVTLNMNNNIQLYFDRQYKNSNEVQFLQNHNNIIVLGSITRDNTNSNIVKQSIYIASQDYNSCIVFGPNSNITSQDRKFISDQEIIHSSKSTFNYLLYPGCTLGDNCNVGADGKTQIVDNMNCVFQVEGNLYLNRFDINNLDTTNSYKLSGLISHKLNIITPPLSENTSIGTLLHINDDDNNPTVYNISQTYFNNLFYSKKNTNDNGIVTSENINLPLTFLYDKSKAVFCLDIDTNNRFAKYNVALWEQCSIDNNKYGFAVYNIEANKDKFINTDILEQLFYDGKTYQPEGSNEVGLLKNMPNIIYPGLTGSKNININTDQDILRLYGDNSRYNGTITFPSNINSINLNGNEYKIVTNKNSTIYFMNSISNSIKPEDIGLTIDYANDIYLVMRYIKEDSIKSCNHKWDLFKDGNKLDINLSEEEWEDKTIILTDSGEVKNNKIQITGNNKGFKGIIITTPEVKEVVFGNNSFVRTVNINGTPLKYTFTGNNKVIDYNDYKTLETKNKNVKVNIISSNNSTHLKNEIINSKKKTNINVEKINVGKNGRLTFGPNNPLILGKK